jgi:alkaline phosphatase
MSGKAGIGWTTGSHTALPVLTTSKGAKAELFTGFIDNTDIAKKLKSVLK